MEYPIKKTFEQDFLSDKGKNLFTLRYEQATMEEYYEFQALSTEQKFLSVYSIIQRQISLLWWERILKWIFPNYISRVERGLDIEKLVVNIIANKFRTSKSIFE